MTREEAIMTLERYGGLFPEANGEYEAIEMAIEALKCEPIVIRCKEMLSKEDFEAVVKRIHEENQNVIVIPCEAEIVSAEVVSTNTSTNTSTKSNISTDTSADRPRGRWHYSDGKPATIGQSFGVICDQCGTESEYCTNFCGECGADMRGDDK